MVVAGCLAGLEEDAGVGGDGLGEYVQVVTAFKYHEQTIGGEGVGKLAGPLKEEIETIDAEADAGQRVVGVSIETGRYQDELRPKVFDGRLEQVGETGPIIGVGCPGFKRHIQRCPEAGACAFFAGRSCAGVTGTGRLVERGIEDAGVRFESVLSAVAVVDVPVDDEDSLQAVDLLKAAGGDGYIVKQAKAHGRVSLGVMAGRTHKAKGVGEGTVDDGVSSGQDCADSQQGHFVRFRANLTVG